jgi:hypothetical protein
MRKITLAIIVVLVIALMYVAYNTFTKPTTEEAAGVSVATPGVAVDTSATSNDFLTLLNNLKSVRFSNALFEDQAFNSLEDFHKELPDRPVGRENPFAPFSNQAQVQFNQSTSTR